MHELQINKRAVPLPAQAPGSLATVSCGVPVAGGEIRILDEEGQPLPERQVGEIIIRTNALFSGYHGQPELTAQVMKDDWFYTGDLGYMAGGHLYICGRKKDMIIVAGRNVYPEDLEAIANMVPGIYSDRAVAFGVFDEQLGSERIVMVCDLKRKAGDAEKIDIERELRRRVHQELDVTLGEVHLVKKGWVVKTINGKIARSANREKYKAMKNEDLA